MFGRFKARTFVSQAGGILSVYSHVNMVVYNTSTDLMYCFNQRLRPDRPTLTQ
jgi:hypothetical protein